MPTFDATAAGLGEPIGPTGHNPKKAAQNAPHALTALESTRLEHIRGAALNQMVETIIAQDDKYLDLDEKEQKAYNQRARRVAYDTLLREQQEAQKREMTKDVYQQRLDALEASSNFATAVQARALELMRTSTFEPCDVVNVDFDKDFEESDEQDEPEGDVEATLGEGTLVVRSLGEEFTATEEVTQEESYAASARSMMELLLNNTLNEYSTWNGRPPKERGCRLCGEDDTASDEMKNKVYSSAYKLETHLKSYYHTPYKVWQRQMQAIQSEQGADDKQFYCPYQHDEPRGYSEFSKLAYHVQHSTVATDGAVHEQQKADDGWFNDDWMQDSSSGAKEGWFTSQVKLFDAYGATMPALNPMRSYPHPDIPGAHYAGRTNVRLVPREGIVRTSDASVREDIMRRTQARIQTFVDMGYATHKFPVA